MSVDQFEMNFNKDGKKESEMKIVREDSLEYKESLEEKRAEIAKKHKALVENIVFINENDDGTRIGDKEARVQSGEMTYSLEDWDEMFNNEKDWYK